MWERQETQEDSLEKEMATHSSILAWKIPWTEDPGRLQSMRLQRVGHNLGTKQRMHMKPIAHRKVLLPLPAEWGEANVGGVGLVDGWMMQGERRDIQGGRFVAAGLREEVVEWLIYQIKC